MLRITRIFSLVTLFVIGPLACDSGADAQQAADRKAAEEKASEQKLAEEKAAAEKAQAEAKRLEEAEKLEKEKSELAYQGARGKLERLATLPRKRPKGFALACQNMFKAYDANKQKTLGGDALANWNGQEFNARFQVMRRACHQREVEVVVCETQLLGKAPSNTDFAHIMRVCQEKFGG
ncbi:MAG: hypothetical protein V3V08_19115 [Nannocystaceae bacterium]